MAQQRDPRYESADWAIRTAFLTLFEENRVEDITVSEIIGAAGVNRSTFYAHYADKYALLDAVEHDFLAQVQEVFESSPTMGLLMGEASPVSAWEAYFTQLVDFLEQHKRLFAGLAGREDSRFMADFSSSFARTLSRRGAVSRLDIPTNYESALLAWGTAGLVEEWARCGFTADRQKVVGLLVHVATSVQETVMG